MERRWKAGWRYTLAGLPLRVVPGAKSPEDLRIDWMTPDGTWRAVPMAAGAIFADFWFDNENVLYPPPAAGGQYYLRYLSQAANDGWEAADGRLKAEQAAKRPQPAPSTVVNWCRDRAPDGAEVCVQPPGHDGPHKGPSWVWPRDRAA